MLRCYGRASEGHITCLLFSLEMAWLLMLLSFLIPLIVYQKKIWWELYRPPAWTSQMRGRENSPGESHLFSDEKWLICDWLKCNAEWIAYGILGSIACFLKLSIYPSNTWKPLGYLLGTCKTRMTKIHMFEKVLEKGISSRLLRHY